MGMTSEDRQALVRYRMEKSAAVFVEAEDNAKLEHWTLVANRLYYSVFYCTLALLVEKGFCSYTRRSYSYFRERVCSGRTVES